MQEADIILGNVPADKIGASKKLEWLQLNSAGADAYAGEGILDKNTVVTTSNGAYGKTVSEHMFAMLLAMQKKLHLYRDSQNKHIWDEHGTVTSIADSTVLIFGMGDIGRHFASPCGCGGFLFAKYIRDKRSVQQRDVSSHETGCVLFKRGTRRCSLYRGTL